MRRRRPSPDQLDLFPEPKAEPALPIGFAPSVKWSGCIEPIAGKHKGVPMTLSSALARALLVAP